MCLPRFPGEMVGIVMVPGTVTPSRPVEEVLARYVVVNVPLVPVARVLAAVAVQQALHVDRGIR